MSTLKLKAHNARLVILYPNPAAKRSSLPAVIDKVFSKDYFKVMSEHGLYNRESFEDIFKTGRAMQIVMTLSQLEDMVKCSEEAEDNNLEKVFQLTIPSYIPVSRTNYCPECGSYHEDGSSVAQVVPLDYARRNDIEECMMSASGGAYGLFCKHCDKSLQIPGLNRSIVTSWLSEYPGDIEDFLQEKCDEWDDWEDACGREDILRAFVDMLMEEQVKKEATAAFMHKQLELLGLDFFSPLTVEEYDAIPLKG